jgi:hypothetical protein
VVIISTEIFKGVASPWHGKIYYLFKDIPGKYFIKQIHGIITSSAIDFSSFFADPNRNWTLPHEGRLWEEES